MATQFSFSQKFEKKNHHVCVCVHRCRKIVKIGGGQTGPAWPPTPDNDKKDTIFYVNLRVQGQSPRKLQDFHKILPKLHAHL